MEPAAARARSNDLPGMNVSYDRRAIAAIDDLLRDGRWEGWLHARLRERGFELYCDPERGARPRQGLRVRRVHLAAVPLLPRVRRRCGTRARRRGASLYALGAPLLAAAALLPHRDATSRARRGSGASFVRATPLILLYIVVWAVGEAVGYAFGGGRQPAEGAVTRAGRSRRDELGEPARLRPLRPQRRRAARRARRGRDRTCSTSTARRRRGRAAAGRGACARRVSAPPAEARQRRLEPAAPRLLRLAARRPRATRLDAFLFPSLYTCFPVRRRADGRRPARRDRRASYRELTLADAARAGAAGG